jgi:hypothetical protein
MILYPLLRCAQYQLGIVLWSRYGRCLHSRRFGFWIFSLTPGGASGSYVSNHPAMRKRRKQCHPRFDWPGQVRGILWDPFSALSLRETRKNEDSRTLFALNTSYSLKRSFEGLQCCFTNCGQKPAPISPTPIPGASERTLKVLEKTQGLLTKNTAAPSPTSGSFPSGFAANCTQTLAADTNSSLKVRSLPTTRIYC